MRRQLIAFAFFISCLFSFAQQLNVLNFEHDLTDITASNNPIYDKNGNKCALVKVLIALSDVEFRSNYLISQKQNAPSEYWVYLAEGTKKLSVYANGFLPLEVDFSDLNKKIKSLESSCTYKLTIEKPFANNAQKLSKVRFIIVPQDASFLIDNTNWAGNNGIIEIPLGSGPHSYSVAAPYHKVEQGSFFVDEDTKEKEIRISLEKVTTDLTINTIPLGATVEIDKIQRGVTPLIVRLQAGHHNIVLNHKGYIKESIDVHIKDSIPSVLNKSLKPEVQEPSAQVSTSTQYYKPTTNKQTYRQTNIKQWLNKNAQLGVEFESDINIPEAVCNFCIGAAYRFGRNSKSLNYLVGLDYSLFIHEASDFDLSAFSYYGTVCANQIAIPLQIRWNMLSYDDEMAIYAAASYVNGINFYDNRKIASRYNASLGFEIGVGLERFEISLGYKQHVRKPFDIEDFVSSNLCASMRFYINTKRK